MLLAAALVAAVSAGDLHQPRTTAGALAAERAWADALVRRDAAGLSRILADGFVDTTWQGSLRTRAEVLAGLAARPQTTLELSDLAVDVHGDMAIVRGVNAAHDAGGRLIGRVRFTDALVYRGRAWRAVAAQETAIAETAP